MRLEIHAATTAIGFSVAGFAVKDVDAINGNSSNYRSKMNNVEP
jgi:hypothetical protein